MDNFRIKKVLKRRTFDMFSEQWYDGVIDEIFNKCSDTKGYVYIVSNGNCLDVKVGKSRNVNSRIHSFNTTFSDGVYLHGFIHTEDESKVEKDIHKLLSEELIRNEWFSIKNSHINSIKEMYGYKEVNSFWVNGTEIDNGAIINEVLYKKPSLLNTEDEIIYNLMDSLDVNIVYLNSEIKEILIDKNVMFNSISSRSITKSAISWADFYGKKVIRIRNNKGRGIKILNKNELQ